MNRYERCGFCHTMQRFPGHYDSACAEESAGYSQQALPFVRQEKGLVMPYKEYTLERFTNGYQLRCHPECEPIRLSQDDLIAAHILSGPILGCSDENCPCHEAGRQKGLKTPREPLGV